jgi:hypothetical protein
MSRLRNAAVVEVTPSAKRLVGSLRDVGYDFVHAVADLVDNSIAAQAAEVRIDIRFNGPESWVRIADDGTGMNGTAITEAMRYGSDRSYESEDLGKFGLGLKLASTSQCRRLTVASRIDPDTNRVEVRQLDLDEIEASDKWAVFIVSAAERPDHLVEPLADGPGTVVLWEQLDRVLQYKIPWGERARAGLLNLAEELDLHLGMVFHRFLSGEVPRRRRPLRIYVNGTAVEPWDPFARTEPHTESLGEQELDVQSPQGVGIVRYSAWVLPPKEKFSNEQMFNRLSGPRRWNQQQGFYIYRANRMIQSGGWSWMRTPDEHTKLARASLDFFSDLDAAFEVNVAKARVVLPADLKDKLKAHVDHLVRRAGAVYRQSPPAPVEPKRRYGLVGPRDPRAHLQSPDQGVPPSSSITPGGASLVAEGRRAIDDIQNVDAGQLTRHDPQVTQKDWHREIEAAATAVGEIQGWGRIVAELRRAYPEVARALGY